jgi:hypothetical protein
MLGIVLLALAALLLLAGEAGLAQAEWVDAALKPLLQAGLAALVVGIALSLLAPLGRVLSSSRCVRCARKIEKGQTYCHDHLKTTVQEYRDKHRVGI